MDYSKLSDFEINKLVAKHEGVRGFNCENVGGGSALKFSNWKELDYCNNPADAWPIIAENRITVMIDDTTNDWSAAVVQDFCDSSAFKFSNCHKNPLRAAMVTFLMMHEAANVQTDSTR